MSLRPERVTIGHPYANGNTFPAQLIEVIYLGDHCKLRLRVAGRDDFVAKVPAERAAGHDKGQAMSVSWPLHACVALPPESSKP